MHSEVRLFSCSFIITVLLRVNIYTDFIECVILLLSTVLYCYTNTVMVIQVSDSGNDTEVMLRVLSSCEDETTILRTISSVHGPWAIIYWQVCSTHVPFLSAYTYNCKRKRKPDLVYFQNFDFFM